MSVFNIVMTILAVIACSWMVWSHRWLGVYMIGFILAGYALERLSPRFGIHPLLAVIPFLAAALYVGYRLFPERDRPLKRRDDGTRTI